MSVAALRVSARAGLMRSSMARLSSNAANLPGAHSTVRKTPASESLSESLQVQQGYANPVDHATSESSAPSTLPVNHPEGGPLSAASISGAPVDLQARTVRIFKKSKPATQSSNWPGEVWTLDWDVLGKGGRWENPLMGWASSGDYMQGTALKFKTKEDAIRFAEKQGYEYFVQEPNVRAFRSKAYAANFTHSPGKLKIVRTK